MTGRCWECNAVGDVHEHHPVPQSRGGTKTIPLCEGCHGKAHHRDGAMSTSALTKAALQAKKARGEKMGGVPFGAGRDDAAKAVRIMLDLRAQGMTLRAIVAELDRMGIATQKGRKWTATTVKRILDRAQAGL